MNDLVVKNLYVNINMILHDITTCEDAAQFNA